MQATNAQHRNLTDEGRHAAWLSVLVVAGLMAHARTLWAHPELDASQVINPQQQATRDRDRIEILREELKNSEAQLEDLMRRKAERLAASDPKAATEAEEQRARTLGDIAAIQRELAIASHALPQTRTVRPAAVQVAKSSSTSKRAAQAPWWDVYSSSRHVEPPASLSIAPPSGKVSAGSSSATGATP